MSRRLAFLSPLLALSALTPVAGCSESHGGDGDAEITFDAAGLDAGRDTGVDAYVVACGNTVLEGGEECDDGNTLSLIHI